MRLLKLTVLFLLVAQLCQAQDTTIVLSTSMIDKGYDVIFLDDLNGWIFKQGNDTGLEKIDIDTAGWNKIKPSELSKKYADKNGRIECWFRINILLDSSFLNKQIGFAFKSWAATELFINGKLVASRGNTGGNGQPFREYNGDIDPVIVNLQSSTPHLLAIHFVGYLSPIPPHELKNQGSMLYLIGPNYFTFQSELTKIKLGFNYLWLSICAVLSLLFWLLLFQNRQEKNLVWIALFTTVLTSFIILSIVQRQNGIPYMQYEIYHLVLICLLMALLFILIPLLLIKVFNRKINRKFLSALIIMAFLNFILLFIPQKNALFANFMTISIGLIVIISLYYLITSWKSLKGAQWAIVFGLLLSISSMLFMIITTTLFNELANSQYFSLINGSFFILSFPLSLLVYVSMRFKEIIKEVRINAKKVVELSEEKKVLAENQQKILQEEVIKQTAELRNTLENLQSTQAQLIQSEKMASLGELTAGIAHEIQNPLNFINNFSEVNTELISELEEERTKETRDLENEAEILRDIKENERKINHHGKRADAIVKGMLQHSRSSGGTREPTDLNILADEFLRLAYHGLRARDKSFNAILETDFDPNLGKVNVVPQDMGRVILNLITNAFYAVNEKQISGVENYQPTVKVSTQKTNGKIMLLVHDNGNGIPPAILEKIFQPFYTTKPAGEGTGLGLSLSYDIVTKGHGGELKVKTKEGEGSEFIVLLNA